LHAFLAVIHSLVKFLKEIQKFPLRIYSTVFRSDGVSYEVLKIWSHMAPYWCCGSWWYVCHYGAICSVLLDVWDICRYLAGGGDKIWITSWGMRRINPCENSRLLLKSLHDEVLWVFTGAVNSLLASSSFIVYPAYA